VWPAVLVAVAGVAVTVFSGYLLSTWPPQPPPTRASAPSPAAQPGPSTPRETHGGSSRSPGEAAQPALVTVLGDGFTAESDVSRGPEWPAMLTEQLGWEVEVDAVDDTGFLHADGGDAFADRVPGILQPSPGVVIVAGGESDLGRYPVEEIAAAADHRVGRLVDGAAGADVVLTSPFSHGAPGPLTAELTDALRRVADEHGVGYVDVSDWLRRGEDLFGEDPDHPLDAGQELIAKNMRTELDRLGLA
jgi:lysophospholipase L1-like esterase